jgi:hypothetical protein
MTDEKRTPKIVQPGTSLARTGFECSQVSESIIPAEFADAIDFNKITIGMLRMDRGG